MDTKRCVNIIGSFNDNCFQVDVRYPVDQQVRVATLNPFGMQAVPQLGHYGDDNIPNAAIIEIVCGNEIVHWRSLFPELGVLDETLPTECFVFVHESPAKIPCGHLLCDKDNEINIWYHAWLYRDQYIDETFEANESLQMGIFRPNGITTTHQTSEEEHRGMPFGHLAPRKVIIHNQRFSPANCEIELQEASYASFFSVAQTKTRQIASFHVIALSATVNAQIVSIAENAQTVLDLITAFNATPELHELISILNLLSKKQ